METTETIIKKDPSKYTVQEVLDSLYYENCDADGDYDGYIHLTSTIDGRGVTLKYPNN